MRSMFQFRKNSLQNMEEGLERKKTGGRKINEKVNISQNDFQVNSIFQLE